MYQNFRSNATLNGAGIISWKNGISEEGMRSGFGRFYRTDRFMETALAIHRGACNFGIASGTAFGERVGYFKRTLRTEPPLCKQFFAKGIFLRFQIALQVLELLFTRQTTPTNTYHLIQEKIFLN